MGRDHNVARGHLASCANLKLLLVNLAQPKILTNNNTDGYLFLRSQVTLRRALKSSLRDAPESPGPCVPSQPFAKPKLHNRQRYRDL